MKILYIAGNPQGASTLKTESEVQLLRAEIDSVSSGRQVELIIHPDLRFDALVGVLARARPNIVHFAAHGSADAILLAQGDGHVALKGEELGAILAGLDLRPGLILLNACNSETMAKALTRHADFIIGTDDPISNIGARQMAATLYSRLASGDTLEKAFETASAVLRALGGGKVNAVLHAADGPGLASKAWFVQKFRILARLPAVDRWLDNRLTNPKGPFNAAQPVIQFGVAGLPAASRLVQLFTDDSDIDLDDGQSLADARGWMEEVPSGDGKIWFEPIFPYYGDMCWYASCVAGRLSMETAVATTVSALERYYLEERRKGDLPSDIGAVVAEVVRNLAAHG